MKRLDIYGYVIASPGLMENQNPKLSLTWGQLLVCKSLIQKIFNREA